MDPILRDTWNQIRRTVLRSVNQQTEQVVRVDLDRVEEELERADKLASKLGEEQALLAESDEERGKLESELTDLSNDRDEYLTRAERAEAQVVMVRENLAALTKELEP